MLSQLLKGPCIFDAKVTNTGAAQRGEAGAVAQGLAEIIGEAADVGAFAASDLEVQFREAVEAEFEVVDPDIAGFQLYLFIGAGIVEGAFPLDFDG